MILSWRVPDRVFFATNESIWLQRLEKLAKASCLVKKNSDVNVVLEGHADERGTREYNLALVKRANAAKII